jgi:hypothetical protein
MRLLCACLQFTLAQVNQRLSAERLQALLAAEKALTASLTAQLRQLEAATGTTSITATKCSTIPPVLPVPNAACQQREGVTAAKRSARAVRLLLVDVLTAMLALVSLAVFWRWEDAVRLRSAGQPLWHHGTASSCAADSQEA